MKYQILNIRKIENCDGDYILHGDDGAIRLAFYDDGIVRISYDFIALGDILDADVSKRVLTPELVKKAEVGIEEND